MREWVKAAGLGVALLIVVDAGWRTLIALPVILEAAERAGKW